MRRLPLVLALLLAPFMTGCQPVGGSDPLDQSGFSTAPRADGPTLHGEMGVETSRSF